MICYLDTSAFVPLLVDEPGTKRAVTLWDQADTVVSCQLLHVEAAAALAEARRIGRLDDAAHVRALALLDALGSELDMVAVDESLARRAGVLASDHALRGYDAVHCAAAERLAVPDLVVASGDRQLLRACRELGMAVADTNPEP